MTRPGQTEAHWRAIWAAELADRDLARLINQDPLAALWQLVRDAGGTMRLHGEPLEQEDLRDAAGRMATGRALAVAAPDLVAGERGPEEHW